MHVLQTWFRIVNQICRIIFPLGAPYSGNVAFSSNIHPAFADNQHFNCMAILLGDPTNA